MIVHNLFLVLIAVNLGHRKKTLLRCLVGGSEFVHLAVNRRVGLVEKLNCLIDGVEMLGEPAHVVSGIYLTDLEKRVVDHSIIELC